MIHKTGVSFNNMKHIVKKEIEIGLIEKREEK